MNIKKIQPKERILGLLPVPWTLTETTCAFSNSAGGAASLDSRIGQLRPQLSGLTGAKSAGGKGASLPADEFDEREQHLFKRDAVEGIAGLGQGHAGG